MSLQDNLNARSQSLQAAVAIPFAPWDRQSFWRSADAAKEATEALADQKMRALAHMPIDALRKFCTQYRFFTIDYISDLALLVSKLPFGDLRTLLSHILSEELGEGDASKAHPVLYDRFLTSIGVPSRELARCEPANRAILDALTSELAQRGPAFGIGLRGMGGECLCQTYLAVMFEHLRAHPWMIEHADEVDWEFWTIHTGEQDIVHGELTRRGIDDFLRRDPGALKELAQGYECSITAWNQFWQNIFDACAPEARTVS